MIHKAAAPAALHEDTSPLVLICIAANVSRLLSKLNDVSPLAAARGASQQAACRDVTEWTALFQQTVPASTIPCI